MSLPAMMFAAVLLDAALLPAHAGDKGPHRCEAVFMGPGKNCNLRGAWTVTATGKTEAQARKLAEKRLAELIVAGVDLRAARAAGTVAMATVEVERKSCPALARETAKIYCHAEPDLAEDQLCFATLDDSRCFSGSPIDARGPGWKALETGLGSLCAAVDEQQSSASEETQLQCKVSCLREARLRCAR
jgi:hypothetical protein